jgi:hypothetical protein
VPAGVPDVEPPVDVCALPPHAIDHPEASNINVAKAKRLRPIVKRKTPVLPISSTHIRGVGVPEPPNLNEEAVLEAVVATVTVTDCGPLPVIWTEELDSLQVGGVNAPGVATGVMKQLKFTVPVNEPEGARDRLKLALCPAFTVCEEEEPEAGLTVKSGAD